MRFAVTAMAVLPSEAAKPSKFDSGRASNKTSGCQAKTTNFKDNAGGIEKGMLMSAIDRNSLVRRGYFALT